VDDRSTNEWLEADGLGGFASGTVSGIRTRRYHAHLLAATRAPAGRRVLVNGLEVWLELGDRRIALSSQRYTPDVIHPDGASRIASFQAEPWPTWRYDLVQELADAQVEHELFVPRGRPMVALSWRLTERRLGLRLCVRPLLSGRDFHALQRENPAFRFAADERDGRAEEPGFAGRRAEADVGGRSIRIVWQPYVSVPAVGAWANGAYEQAPDWYRNFQYDKERERGLDFVEDLGSPGVFSWDLTQGKAVLLLALDEVAAELFSGHGPLALFEELRDVERARRSACGASPQRSAGSYLVRRGEGETVIAGYPWFGDWGRDSFISLRGLCLATGRLQEALSILLEWSGYVSEGMLPNRFPDDGDPPEYNSVDASLWFVIAVDAALQAARDAGHPVSPEEANRLLEAVDAVLDGYSKGTRHGIHADGDGLLAAGSSATQLTWMDARFEGRPVTPRAGKPVEVQALWLNALWLQRERVPTWAARFEQGRASFAARFWNLKRGCLFDVVDVEGKAGQNDDALRPNQIFAIGGLPLQLLPRERARSVVDIVERTLWTPIGLRSLAPSEPGYLGRYLGDLRQRDEAYHQGTVWTWLAGPFIEAWLRVHEGESGAAAEARSRFVQPLLDQLGRGGLGHLPEIADGDPPHTPRGCPFQAWSLGELLRALALVG
jgi:glycogen debranching enzyme